MILPSIGLALLAHKAPHLRPTRASTAILHPRRNIENPHTGEGGGESNHAEKRPHHGNGQP